MVNFENMDRRKVKINDFLKKYAIDTLESALQICTSNGMDPRAIVLGIQPIAFEDAVWAYTIGAAAAIKAQCEDAISATNIIGEALQAFTIKGSIAESRKVGIGHGALAARLFSEATQCMALVAGHESWAAAEGALGIVKAANAVRTKPLRVILNGLGKDAGFIMARINGFTYVKTVFDHQDEKLQIVGEKAFSNSERSQVRLYACSDVREAIAVMIHERVDISITGNTANALRFQHLVTGSYKKWTIDNNVPYFSVASGGGTGRTMHPDNVGAGPACYGITDSLGRVHGDVQFAGSSSVPAHVEMMGMIGMGNNPIVAATLQTAVAVRNAVARS